MPTKILNCGAMIFLDEEDMPLVATLSWHIYPIKPNLRPCVARTEKRFNRMHRLLLHREVSIRQDPSLIGKRYRVLPINGDYLDCRRANLEIRMAKKKRGVKPREPRPIGWLRAPVVRPRFDSPPPSPSWAGGIIWRRVQRKHYCNKEYLPLIGGHGPDGKPVILGDGQAGHPLYRHAGGRQDRAGHEDEGLRDGPELALPASKAEAEE